MPPFAYYPQTRIYWERQRQSADCPADNRSPRLIAFVVETLSLVRRMGREHVHRIPFGGRFV